MTRLIDADALKETINAHDYVLKDCTNSTDKGMFTVGIMQAIDEQPTIDAVPLDGSFLKMSRGDYLIYKRNWLYEHFDMEMEIQRSAMKSMGYEYVGKNTDAVRHGKWVNANEGRWNTCEVLKCSECGELDNRMYKTDKYCPNCGCRMDEE